MLPEQFGSLKAQAQSCLHTRRREDARTILRLLESTHIVAAERRHLRTQGGDLHRLAQRHGPRCGSGAHPDQDPPDGNAAHQVQFRLRRRGQPAAALKGAIYSGGDPGRPSEELCNDPTANGLKAYVDLCAGLPGGAVDPLQKVVAVNWWSAKHHVLVMHHCFEALRGQLNPLQAPASGSDVLNDRKLETMKPRTAASTGCSFRPVGSTRS